MILATAPWTVAESSQLDGATMYDLCDESAGRRVLMEYGEGLESLGTFDCAVLGAPGSMLVWRYDPNQRRGFRVQVILSSGVDEPSGGRWWKDSKVVTVVASPFSDEGVVAGDGGETIYVTTSEPTELAVFGRSTTTGMLTIRETRRFVTGSERSEFMDQLRQEWRTNRSKRQNDHWYDPHPKDE